MTADSPLSFDRMRGMLMRAAEIRDSEQQQIFDSLDEIHARLAGLDALGTVRKRLTELPDRTEVSVLAERLDETVAKLDAQDVTLSAVARAIEALPDRLAAPIAQLDGRLDGMAGRLEGVSGRMDGLDDRLGGLHKRLDDLDNRLDRHELRLDAMPAAVSNPIKERIDGVERMVREHLAGATRSMEETGEGLRNLLGDTAVGLHRRLEDLATRPSVDPTALLDGLAQRLESLTARLDALDAAVVERPDTASLSVLVERANEDSARRSAEQLDEAMATFAELILGRGAAVRSPLPGPRPVQRRTVPRIRAGNGSSPDPDLPPDDDPDT
ncbi:MAG: PA containing protein [Pseudonocardia sp.]